MRYKNKRIFIILVLVIALLLTLLLVSCDRVNNTVNIIVSGDVQDHYTLVELSSIEESEYSYEDEAKQWGYNLKDVLDKCNLPSEDNWILLTAEDLVSARIDYSTADFVWLVYEENEDGQAQLNVKAPQHPRVVGIKNLIDITIISKGDLDSGLKLVKKDSTQVLSYGTAKLNLFEQVAENSQNGNIAYKHMPKNTYSVEELTGESNNILYFANHDIIKDDSGVLIWQEGRLSYSLEDDVYTALLGIVSGVEHCLFDAYNEMKQALDNDEKVMFILPDGLSIKQVEHYQEELTLFASNYTLASSVNPAISNVALASIITGLSPYNNGIVERGIKAPEGGDIFDYALDLGKDAIYIEGNSNLVITNLDPRLNMPDIDGYTDTAVYNSAIQAIGEEPDFLFVHFHGIDDVNHEYSQISNEARAKILETEDYIEDLIDAWDGKVILLPDHGHITYYDQDNIARGHHGFFEADDMIVPYYIFD